MGTKLVDGVKVGEWVDISGMLDEIRLVKSAVEQTYMRLAVRAVDAGTQAAIDAIHDGALIQVLRRVSSSYDPRRKHCSLLWALLASAFPHGKRTLILGHWNP